MYADPYPLGCPPSPAFCVGCAPRRACGPMSGARRLWAGMWPWGGYIREAIDSILDSHVATLRVSSTRARLWFII